VRFVPHPGRERSFWLQQALAADPGRPCPSLASDERADVCIVGGGYTGLWTALELKRRDPATRVVLIEADICGAGASGRNGAFATSWWDELPELEARFGRESALVLAEAVSGCIARIGAFCAERGIDGYLQRGNLTLATCEAHVGRWMGAVEACRAVGRAGLAVPISGDDARARTGCPLALAGVHWTDGARVHPGLLVRGLRAAALEAGVRIYEHSPMRALDHSAPARVTTPGGGIEADRVVLATNAWLARMGELRRAIIPVASYIVLTEPAPERIARMGWSAGEMVGDARTFVHYTHVTREGRVAFGRGGGAIGSFGRVPGSMEHDRTTAEIVAADFRRFFPQLAALRITHAWGGAVDRAPGHLPFAGALAGASHVVYFGGYSGNGVAPSRMAGDVLASLVRGEHDALVATGIADGPPGYLPPEPLRSLGGRAVRRAVLRREALEERGQRPDRVTLALSRLTTLTVPRAIEPRLRRRSGL